MPPQRFFFFEGGGVRISSIYLQLASSELVEERRRPSELLHNQNFRIPIRLGI